MSCGALWAVQADSGQPHPLHCLCVCKGALEPAFATLTSNEQGGPQAHAAADAHVTVAQDMCMLSAFSPRPSVLICN